MWWIQIMKEKYYYSSDVDSPKLWSPIWKLIHSMPFLIDSHLNQIPGNGDSILIWEDPILHQLPFQKLEELCLLREFMLQNGIRTLVKASQWDKDGAWSHQNFGNLSCNLNSQGKNLEEKLSGKYPIHRPFPDKVGQRSSSYLIKEGYVDLLFQYSIPPKSSIQGKVCSLNAFPKFNAIFWLLVKKKFHSEENMKGRGIQGQSRCPLCGIQEGSIQHLFVDYHFSKKVWSHELGPLFARIHQPIDLLEFFSVLSIGITQDPFNPNHPSNLFGQPS